MGDKAAWEAVVGIWKPLDGVRISHWRHAGTMTVVMAKNMVDTSTMPE